MESHNYATPGEESFERDVIVARFAGLQSKTIITLNERFTLQGEAYNNLQREYDALNNIHRTTILAARGEFAKSTFPQYPGQFSAPAVHEDVWLADKMYREHKEALESIERYKTEITLANAKVLRLEKAAKKKRTRKR